MLDAQTTEGRRRPNVVARGLALLLVIAMVALSSPFAALALDTQRFTARPNNESGNELLGGKETRITWEFEVGADEKVAGISLTFPDGTSFSGENSKVTMLSDKDPVAPGNDLLLRTPIDATLQAEGQTGVFEFAEPAAAGGHFVAEFYGVVFPREGGSIELQGSVTLDDGTVILVDDLPAIKVTGVTLAQSWANDLEQQDWVKKWNSNKFLRLFFNPPLLITSFPVVLKGFFMALGIVFCAFPLAIPLGLLLALFRMSKFRVLRAIGTTYVNVVRGTPLFLQIYIAFFGLPLAGIQVPPFILGVCVLFLNSGAYLCEIFRAGIQSIPQGQFEASRSLGLNGGQTMFFVIIPQTVRRVIPTMTSEFILLYKDTSLLAAVGVMEVVMYAKTIVATTGSITPYIVAACFYLIITIPLASLVGKLERKLDVNTRGAVPEDKDTEPEPSPVVPAGLAETAGTDVELTVANHSSM